MTIALTWGLKTNGKAKYFVWSCRFSFSHTINDRQRKVINRLLDGFKGKLTSSKYAKMTDCSHDTALRDIKLLISYGILRVEGESRRGASYMLNI